MSGFLRRLFHRHRWHPVWWQGDIWARCEDCAEMWRVPAENLAEMPHDSLPAADLDLPMPSGAAIPPGGEEPPDLRDLVLRFRHVAEHPAIGNPFRSPEWHALCAATNKPRD